MRLRAAPLRQAAIFAAVFTAARVVYAAAFAGAAGTGIRLIDLPLVSLPAPFTGVQLLGPVTLDGLGRVVLSAAPFAAVILGFGVLNSLFDVRPWFAAAARRGPLRSFARALVIAWQTLPALAAALRRAVRAARLRGERPGPSALVPVLEDSIERAVALAASLELRGFAASHRLEGDCEVPVQVTDAVLERPGWTLSIPRLELAPGALTVLTGATGSGKSTVLDALSGLFQHADGGVQRGLVEIGGLDRAAVPPRETAGFVGMVAQRVRAAFVGETVAEELGYTLALRGVAPVIVEARAREIAERLGIAQLLPRPVAELSAGEAELVAIGAALAERPTLLLVDEPLAELDRVARPLVVAALASLAHEGGVCVVVAEHRVAWFEGVADGWLTIADGELRCSEPLSAARNPAAQGGCEQRTRREPMATRMPIAEVRELSVRHGARVAVDEVSLELRAGEVVALVGPNGAGKSSLLEALALPAQSGKVFVGGDDVSALKAADRRMRIALVPEALEDLFVTDSVAAECRRADRHSRRNRQDRRDAGATLRRFGELLGGAPRELADAHPRDLSGGQRVCLAIALQLAAAPAVLLVDEPVRGLDARARGEVAAALARAAAAGAAVLFATHEAEFASAVAERTIRLEGGRIAEEVLA
ncbi:ATP-binding cassette domain-containing protein [Gryllotalpicola koreensis]|uniref:ABC transporter domain-containing protein n=1 Tax=Gryllotalpicola koreensis TaxID=993086 RepID=A0ABP7ZYX7_9MICO